MVIVCSMVGCFSNSIRDKNRSFFRYPKDEKRCKLWVEASGRTDLWDRGPFALFKGYYVCDLHFDLKDRLKKRLRLCAVPKHHYMTPRTRVENDSPTTSTQTQAEINNDFDPEVDTEDGDPGSSNIVIKSERSTPTDELEVLEYEATGGLAQLYDHLPHDLKMLSILEQRIKKIPDDLKLERGLNLFALKLYLSSPNTYRVLRSTLDLPTVATLRKTDIEIDTILRPELLRCLESKIKSLSESEKYCTICVGSMPLEKFLFYLITQDKIFGFHDIAGKQTLDPATTVYAVMARGISLKWEQLIGYCFFSETKKFDEIIVWLEDTVANVMDIGFNVVALVVDHEDPELYNLANTRHVTSIRPYLLINNQRIYFIFDVPQLILSLRNALMKYEFVFHDNPPELLDTKNTLLRANWEPLASLWKGNKTRSTLPQLTRAHVHPKKSEKNELKYAVEVFSKSVSEALAEEYIRRPDKENNMRVLGLSKLTGLVNDIFNVINSSDENDKESIEKNALAGKVFMDFLFDVRIYDEERDVTAYIKCLNGLKISVKSIIEISRDLLLLCKDIKSLPTQRFNKAPLDRLFDSVRQKAKSNKPKAIEFFKSYRKLFTDELFKCFKTNKSDDLSQFVSNVTLRNLHQTKLKKKTLPSKILAVVTDDYRFKMTNDDAFQCVCNYLLKKLYSTHRCADMQKYVHSSASNINWRRYVRGMPIFKPPESFVELIKRMDDNFNSHFGVNMENGVGTVILMTLRDTRFHEACLCFPMTYVARLFIRLRIFNIIRYNNRRFKDKSFHFSKTDNFTITKTS